MDIVQLIAVLIVVGLLWYLVATLLPLPQPIRTVVLVLLVLLICGWLLNWAGLWPGAIRLRH